MNDQGGRVLRDLLRSVRLEAGLRQQDVAERLGMPQSYVSKCESGERRMDVLELASFCEACGTDLRSFVEELLVALNSVNK